MAKRINLLYFFSYQYLINIMCGTHREFFTIVFYYAFLPCKAVNRKYPTTATTAAAATGTTPVSFASGVVAKNATMVQVTKTANAGGSTWVSP